MQHNLSLDVYDMALTYHLSLLRHLLNVCNYFLLLLFQSLSFSVQVSHGPVQSSLVLPQHLFWGLPLSK